MLAAQPISALPHSKAFGTFVWGWGGLFFCRLHPVLRTGTILTTPSLGAPPLLNQVGSS
jgi:hypothetical protein